MSKINLASNIEFWATDRLRPYAKNARTHDSAQIAKIAASITEFGFTNPILVDGADGIIAGHGRLMAAQQGDGFDLELTGFSNDELDKLLEDAEDQQAANDNEASEGGAGSLAARFMLPPFTVLNAREGWWQDRKRSWLALGIKSEEGREIAPTNVSKNTPDYMAGRGNNDGGSIFDPAVFNLLSFVSIIASFLLGKS